MRSFEHDYLLETPILHPLLMSARALGEFRGRQMLYAEQSPEVKVRVTGMRQDMT